MNMAKYTPTWYGSNKLIYRPSVGLQVSNDSGRLIKRKWLEAAQEYDTRCWNVTLAHSLEDILNAMYYTSSRIPLYEPNGISRMCEYVRTSGAHAHAESVLRNKIAAGTTANNVVDVVNALSILCLIPQNQIDRNTFAAMEFDLLNLQTTLNIAKGEIYFHESVQGRNQQFNMSSSDTAETESPTKTNKLQEVNQKLSILRAQRHYEKDQDKADSLVDAIGDLRAELTLPKKDVHFHGNVYGQNQQFNAGGGNQQNNKTVKTAMIEYDNKLLNNPGLLSAGSQVYGIKKTLDAVLRFDDRMISEIVQNNDEDLLLAGILSFEDYA
jgi:hypothetical protein